MKKLVLVFAMMLGSVGVFAQTNNMSAKMINKNDLLSAKAQSEMMNTVHQKPILKSYADGTTALCDFSDATAYTFGVTSRHSATEEFTLLNTSADVTKWWTLRAFNVNGSWTTLFEPNPQLDGYIYMPMSITNGFAGFDLNSQQTTETVDAYIKINQPIMTTGNGIDIHFMQYLYSLFNHDEYFVDWSTDPNFADGSYDSVAFNVKNVDIAPGSILRDRKMVNIPTGTSICNIATANQQIYVRLRISCPSVQYNGGYQWFVDDISYATTPADRVEYSLFFINDGYRKIPSILEPEPFRTSVTVQNTGSAVADSLRLVNQFYSVSQSSEGDGVTFSLISQAATTTPLSLANQIRIDTNGVPYRYEVVSVDTNAISQPGDEVGAYAYTSDLFYKINNEEKTVNLDTNYYYMTGEDVARSHCYTWQKDMGIFMERLSGVWNHTFVSEGAYGESTTVSTDGHRICIAYTKYTNKINTPVYAAGVEVVPAIDSCEAGATIKASLWQWNPAATSMSDVIVEATDNTDNPIVSNEYTLTAADLNNATDPNEDYERFADGDYNTVFMPFTYQGLELSDSSTYYACYTKVGSNGKFYVAKDYERWNSYSYDNGYSILVWTPSLLGSQRQYDWGYVWFTQAWSSGTVPAIRLIVSDINNPTPSSIEDVNAEATSDMQVYPNPAADKVTLSYTLTQSGNVNITIMDVMGRVVMSENQGKKEAGFAYKTNINTSNMNNGTYFYTVEVNGAKSTNKLVINR